MATATRSNDFTAGETIVSAEVNEDLDDLFALVNDELIHADGTNAFTSVPGGPSTDPTSDNQYSRKAYTDKKAGGVVVRKTYSTAGSLTVYAAGVPGNTYHPLPSALNYDLNEIADHWYEAVLHLPQLTVAGSNVRVAAALKRDGSIIAESFAENAVTSIGGGIIVPATWKATSSAETELRPFGQCASLGTFSLQVGSGSVGPASLVVKDLGIGVI